MSVEIVTNDTTADVFVCNTTERAFGPVMEVGTAEAFMEWLTDDPRAYMPDKLDELYETWYNEVYMKEGEEESED